MNWHLLTNKSHNLLQRYTEQAHLFVMIAGHHPEVMENDISRTTKLLCKKIVHQTIKSQCIEHKNVVEYNWSHTGRSNT